MKKILLLFFIIFLSCEKTEIDNELVGTEWTGIHESEYSYDKSGWYNEWFNPETGYWENDKTITKTMVENFLIKFSTNDILHIHFYARSTDGILESDTTITRRYYKWDAIANKGDLLTVDGDYSPGTFTINGDKMHLYWGSWDNIQLTKR